MGHETSYQLREDNLMTKVLLKEQDQVIEHIQEDRLDLDQPINQMGDTIMHYAAYNSLKKLLEYLLDKGCDPNCCNNRGLSPIDVALPQIREWIIQRYAKDQHHRQRKEKQSSQNKSKQKQMTQSLIIANHMTKQ